MCPWVKKYLFLNDSACNIVARGCFVTVCVYAAHLYAGVILTATKRQRYTCNVFFSQDESIFPKAHIWDDYQHDYLVPEGVINSSPCTILLFLDVCGTVYRIFCLRTKRVWNKQDIDWNLSVILQSIKWQSHLSDDHGTVLFQHLTSPDRRRNALSCKLRNHIQTC